MGEGVNFGAALNILDAVRLDLGARGRNIKRRIASHSSDEPADNLGPKKKGDNMFKMLLAAIVLMVSGSSLLAQQPPKKYVEVLTIGEFLKLPFDFQVMYVAGITDGFTYVMRNYDVAGYEEFSACVRRVSLKIATEEMVEQIRQRKEDEPLTTYFAKSLGARCHRK